MSFLSLLKTKQTFVGRSVAKDETQAGRQWTRDMATWKWRRRQLYKSVAKPGKSFFKTLFEIRVIDKSVESAKPPVVHHIISTYYGHIYIYIYNTTHMHLTGIILCIFFHIMCSHAGYIDATGATCLPSSQR